MDFDQALLTLLGWNGRKVMVTVHENAGSGLLAMLYGTLAGAQMQDIDLGNEDEILTFALEPNNCSKFVLDRSIFRTAHCGGSTLRLNSDQPS